MSGILHVKKLDSIEEYTDGMFVNKYQGFIQCGPH